MPTPRDIHAQHERLAASRATLQHYLHQRAMSGAAHVRPEVTAGIAEARAQIRRIKATLQQWGEPVEDQPDDDEDAPQARAVAGRPTSGVSFPQPRPVDAVHDAGGAPTGPPARWERFRNHPLIFYPVIGFTILAALFSCIAMAISAGSDFGGFRQQLQAWGIIAEATPTAAPTATPASVAWRIYPNPEPEVAYIWYIWREPPGVPESSAGATPTTMGDGRSWNRFRYDLGANQFAALALTFAAPLDISAYSVLAVRAGFAQVSDRCRLYLKEAGPADGTPTPTSGLPRDGDSGVLLGLGERADRPGVSTTFETGGVQTIAVDLRAQFPRTDLTRVIEIGFEALPDPQVPAPGQCDIYEVALRP